MAEVYNSQLDAFDLYHKVQERAENPTAFLSGPALPALGHALAGSTGAAISNVTTYPLALIITRLQIQRQLRSTGSRADYKSVADAAQKIYDGEGGLRGLFVGVTSDTGKTIADSFLFFLAYTFLRRSRQQQVSRDGHAKRLSAADELGVGFLAGAFAKMLTTPLANIVTHKQTDSMLIRPDKQQEGRHASTQMIARQIYQEKGLQGFWAGYSASLILTLNPSLTFFFFETMKRIVLPHDRRSNPTPQVTFLLAAMSKAMASAITYPFSSAKSRLQVRGAGGGEGGNKSEITKNKCGRSNIVSMVLQIVKQEGTGSLYEGLRGELLKGFLSHGTTMIIKDVVHQFVIQLYYTVLKLLRRYPTPQHLAQGTQQIEHVASNVTDRIRDAATTVMHSSKLPL